jgi:hypothetical protein
MKISSNVPLKIISKKKNPNLVSKVLLIKKFIKEIIIITFMFKTFVNVMDRNILKSNIFYIIKVLKFIQPS